MSYEIRKWDEKIDEIVSGQVDFFHLEYMDDGHVWIGLTLRNGKQLMINLVSDNEIECTVEQ